MRRGKTNDEEEKVENNEKWCLLGKVDSDGNVKE